MGIVAYAEKESFDPITGEPGVLRTEWRVDTLKKWPTKALQEAWGPDWQCYRPFATHVLCHRYIRRGCEEPWQPSQAATSHAQALEYVGEPHVAVSAGMKKLDAIREKARQEREKKREEEKAEEAEKQRKREQREARQAAFRRLQKTPEGCKLAERWNAVMGFGNAEREVLQKKVSEDKRLFSLYQTAMEATKMMQKRKAMRLFLEAIGK